MVRQGRRRLLFRCGRIRADRRIQDSRLLRLVLPGLRVRNGLHNAPRIVLPGDRAVPILPASGRGTGGRISVVSASGRRRRTPVSAAALCVSPLLRGRACCSCSVSICVSGFAPRHTDDKIRMRRVAHKVVDRISCRRGGLLRTGARGPGLCSGSPRRGHHRAIPALHKGLLLILQKDSGSPRGRRFFLLLRVIYLFPDAAVAILFILLLTGLVRALRECNLIGLQHLCKTPGLKLAARKICLYGKGRPARQHQRRCAQNHFPYSGMFHH